MVAVVEALPLLELSPIIDIFADGVHRVEVVGDNARFIFFTWRSAADGTWEKHAGPYAILQPLRSLQQPIERWPNVVILGKPTIMLKALN